MGRLVVSRRKLKEIEKHHTEKRTALLQSINTADDFRQALKPIVEALSNSPDLDISAYRNGQAILMRGHQILDPETFGSILESLGIPQDFAQELINDEIKTRTAKSINAPFFDYMEEIGRRAVKLAREMKAGKYNQDIFRIRFTSLYIEYQQLEKAWNELPGRPETMPLMTQMYKPLFDALATWLD